MKKKLVIVGGGFAGALIAKKLETKFNVILIDTKDYFEFTPGILRTLVQPSHIKKIQVLHSHYLKYAKTIKGCVTKIDKKYVYCDNKKISFNYLVIASGSSYNRIIKEPNSLAINRAKVLKEKYMDIIKAKKIVIVGGGIVAVELAGEVTTFFDDKEITIIELTDRLMFRMPLKVSQYAENFLKKRNVRIIFNEKVTSSGRNYVKTNKGKELKYSLLFNCTGIKPNSNFMKPFFKNKIDEIGFIKINNHLQLEDYNNIFVAGDVASVKEEKLAQNAQIHARLIAENIINLENNRPLKEYEPKQRLMVISLGKYDGIIVYKNTVLRGIIPGLLKSFIEWMEMLKYK
ncbi:FAD-dependent oxidoreductase [Candidatus Pacearchaeota archaeon]|nr:FAD-dependent oxidoreductase [Candidatus Pacearchaeota archaeon]